MIALDQRVAQVSWTLLVAPSVPVVSRSFWSELWVLGESDSTIYIHFINHACYTTARATTDI